ncbi:hypothetical protein I3760_01G076300, partial [Carya illinoinensis]
EWANSVVEYLNKGKLPEKNDEARKIRRKAVRFILIDRVIYKRAFSTQLLRCISLQEAQYILIEIYERICRNHSRKKTLAKKTVRVGYY